MSSNPPTRLLRGRVADVRPAGSAQEILLVVEDTWMSLRVKEGLPPVQRGDLVALEVEDGVAVSAQRLGGVQGGAWDPEGDPLRWRRAGSSPSRMKVLWQRQTIVRAIRDFFFERGFLEIQAPLLVRGTCPDVHMSSVRAGDGYLTTSTEYQIKRMVAGGFERLFTLTQNFRASDVSERHNPEFTMLEWARAGEPLDAIEADAEELVKRALRALHPGQGSIEHRGAPVKLDGVRWERLTVREALRRYLSMDVAPDFSLDSMRKEVGRLGLDVPPSFLEEPHGLVSLLLDRVQPRLGAEVPTFLREWPAFMTSSAALREGAPAVAERSELFIAGLEVSDGFPSLCSAAEQRALFERERARRSAEGKEPVDLDERYLEALRLGLPPGAGMALGVDRLVMLLTGQQRIRDVLAFAWDEL
jgi:elongation factor P--(R)-beta-lysine ligase